MMKKYKLESKVWLWPGEQAAWHFASVPKTESAEIKAGVGKKVRGFGSVPVKVTIGKTSWNTSIFPDSKSGQYLLPLKAKVRQAEGIFADETVKFTLEIK